MERWGAVFLVSALTFLALAFAVSLTGVWPVERAVYRWIIGLTAHSEVVAAFRRITRLGSESFVLPVTALLLVALPGGM